MLIHSGPRRESEDMSNPHNIHTKEYVDDPNKKPDFLDKTLGKITMKLKPSTMGHFLVSSFFV